MEDDTRYLVNNLKLMIRRIAREELEESNQKEIDIEDYRGEIEDIVQEYVKNEIEDIVRDYVNNNLHVNLELK